MASLEYFGNFNGWVECDLLSVDGEKSYDTNF